MMQPLPPMGPLSVVTASPPYSAGSVSRNTSMERGVIHLAAKYGDQWVTNH